MKMVMCAVLGLACAFVFPKILQADTVTCLSEVCGAGTVRDYYYGVSIDTGHSLSSFTVGTYDGNISHYEDWTAPTGWNVEIVDKDLPLGDLEYTAHGSLTSYDGLCPYQIHWWGTTLETGNYYFGFNNSSSPADVGWKIDYATCDWDKAVAGGEGPIHAPVPEPGAIMLLVIGLASILAYVWQKR